MFLPGLDDSTPQGAVRSTAPQRGAKLVVPATATKAAPKKKKKGQKKLNSDPGEFITTAEEKKHQLNAICLTGKESIRPSRSKHKAPDTESEQSYYFLEQWII